jgi:RNA polymerase sigma-70 factor (ECF subfamily)
MSTADLTVAFGRDQGARAALQRVVRKPPSMSEASKLALFEKTIVPHLNGAYRLARWLTGNQQDAEDVVQEAYLRALRFFDGFRGGDGRAWLLAIVRNTCLSWMARRAGAASASVEFDEQVHGTSDEAENSEEALITNSNIDSLRTCIQALPAEYREVIVMREMEELSYREISEVAGIPIGTVMSRLSRGRMRLLDCMEAKG